MIRYPARAPASFIRRLVAVCGFLPLVLSPPLAARCSELHQGRIPNPQGGQIRVVAESAGAPVEQRAIDAAISMWAETCAPSLPRFGAAGNIVMRLRFHDGPNDMEGCGDGCACTISNTLPAADGGEYLVSSITHLFERHRDGRGYCRRHREETLAHEIGHVLGFRHPDDPYSPECAGLIMSFTPNRSVRPPDCRALTGLWRLPRRFDDAQGFAHQRWLPPQTETEGALRNPEKP